MNGYRRRGLRAVVAVHLLVIGAPRSECTPSTWVLFPQNVNADGSVSSMRRSSRCRVLVDLRPSQPTVVAADRSSSPIVEVIEMRPLASGP